MNSGVLLCFFVDASWVPTLCAYYVPSSGLGVEGTKMGAGASSAGRLTGEEPGPQTLSQGQREVSEVCSFPQQEADGAISRGGLTVEGTWEETMKAGKEETGRYLNLEKMVPGTGRRRLRRSGGWGVLNNQSGEERASHRATKR